MENRRQLPILSVVQIGNHSFERYVIEDQRNRQWTGCDFSKAGILYAKHNAAAIDSQAILKGYFEGIQPVRYVAPVVIEVHSHEPVHVAEVARHLSRTSRLYLNTTQHGNGPGGSLVLPWIEWHRIERAKETPNE